MFDKSISLHGPERLVFIPESLMPGDPKDVGRALAAWRYNLSHDEIRLLEHLAGGLTNAEIAEQMGVAEENTIKNRIKNIFNKLGVTNRVQAAVLTVHYGFGEKPGISTHPRE